MGHSFLGFMTAKGELVRAILYPKSKNKMLQSDLLKNNIVFALLTIPAMMFTVFSFARLEVISYSILF
jgi:hypothetical protein